MLVRFYSYVISLQCILRTLCKIFMTLLKRKWWMWCCVVFESNEIKTYCEVEVKFYLLLTSYTFRRLYPQKRIHSFIHSFIHSVLCLTTGPHSLRKRVHIIFLTLSVAAYLLFLTFPSLTFHHFFNNVFLTAVPTQYMPNPVSLPTFYFM
jgi:hypothetical protein